MATPSQEARDLEPGSATAISIVGVHKSFGKQHVLNDLSLEVPRGQVTVVIGQSGAGKSVLLKLVLGLITPDKGQVFIGGEDIVALGARKKRKVRARFGMVFQDGALFDSMSVFDNVAFPLREHTRLRRREVQERVMRRLTEVGLEDHGHKLPSNLSGGMRKRASLARALVRDPEFLLYDEPTTGLDPIRTASIDNLISATQAANPQVTSLIISHDMTATFRIAHHVAMLHKGTIIAVGGPEEIRQSEDPRVRQFVLGLLDGPIDA